MPYPILNGTYDASKGSLVALAIMAKAPRAGKVKTRLCPPLTSEQAAALNICCLKDTAQNLHEISQTANAACLICYTPAGEERLFDGLLPDDFSLILQRGDGFGERLLHAAEDILACGFKAVCLIDSDSPTVPAAAFQQAVAELSRPSDRVVLGGSHDGGYYLIGLKQPHPAPFQNITWSTSSVFAETVAGTKAAGIEVVQLPLWYDVDDRATLDLLSAELLDRTPPPFTTIGGYSAPYSRELLSSMRATALTA